MATREREQQTTQQSTQRPKNLRWLRVSFLIIGLVAISVGAAYWVTSPKQSSIVLSIVFAVVGIVVGAVVGAIQWLFPLSPDTKKSKNANRPDLAAPIIAAAQPIQVTITNRFVTDTSKPIAVPVPKSPGMVFQANMTLTNLSEFFGRINERDKLLDRIRKGASTSIVGPRRIGKTWLLKYLCLNASTILGSAYRVGFIDAYLPSCSTLKGFIETVLEELEAPVARSREPLSLVDLEKAMRDFKRTHTIPIVCIDNFERFKDSGPLGEFDSSFFSGLRALTYEGLILITASRVPLFDIIVGTMGSRGQTSPFSNIFTQLKLRPFTESEAVDFVRIKAAQAGFSEKEQACLLQYSRDEDDQWPPLMLQLAGEMILEDKLENSEQDHLSHLEDEKYWQRFMEHLEDVLRGKIS